MKPASRTAFILATVLLHTALIAAAIAGFSTKPENKPPEPLPVTVELIAPSVEAPTLEAAAAPPPLPPPEVKPAPATKPPPRKKQPVKEPPSAARKPAVTAEPVVPPSTTTALSTLTPAPAPAIDSPAPSAPSAPPAPPARTGVSISASYASSNRKPPYPVMSRRYEEQGTVVLRVQVKADGTAGAVEIKKSSNYPMLDESARSTVQTWRFNPATQDGKPVTEWYELAIPFKLEN